MKRFTVLAPLLDLVYLAVAICTAPWWMRKARGGWGERFGKTSPLPEMGPEFDRRLLLHAVSVGEVNLTRPLVAELARAAPRTQVVIASTTDTGTARARELYGATHHVVRFPLDASWAVRRFLRAVRPDAVALVELELWPNFMRICAAGDVPVCVVNGRLSARSFKGYRRLRGFMGRYFAQLAFAAVQDDAYRDRFVEMGVSPSRCVVAGSMKWDGVAVGETVEGADDLARELGIDRARPLVVAGSTAPGEHELLRDALPEGAQLLCAPRRPEWFDQAAEALPGCARRSAGGPGAHGSGLFLLDTMGELRKAYALADVVVVGRSFGALHGSDPMEPAALGKPLLIGPAHSDFESAVSALREGGALEVVEACELAARLAALLADGSLRSERGRSAERVVRAHQGPARAHAQMLRELMEKPSP